MKQWKQYKQLCVYVGFVVNDKKSFISETRGTFCEGLYELKDDRLQLIPTIPLSGLINRKKGSTIIEDVPTLAWSLVRRGISRHLIHKLLRVTKNLSIFEKAGINLEKPKELGGLGLPPIRNFKLSKIEADFLQGIYLKKIQLKKYFVIPPNSCKFSRIFSKKFVSNIDYSYAVPKEQRCDHVDQLIGFGFARCSIYDFEQSKNLKNKRVSLSRQVKSLVAQKKYVYKVANSLQIEHRERFVEDSFKIMDNLFALPSSMKLLFNHSCSSRGSTT